MLHVISLHNTFVEVFDIRCDNDLVRKAYVPGEESLCDIL